MTCTHPHDTHPASVHSLVLTECILCTAACLPGRGGKTCTACARGTWSAGGATAVNPTPPCAPCKAGFTTCSSGATSASDCTGGWGCMDTTCAAAMLTVCSACASAVAARPTGRRTAVIHSTHHHCCSAVCLPGRGGNACTNWQVGSWSAGGNTTVLRPHKC